MILYKTSKTNIAQENCMMLEVGDGFVYLSKNVYDQIIILDDRFESDYTIIKNKLGLGDNQEPAIEYFVEAAPEPLNILAPFLGLVEGEELEQDIEVLCGVLHQMSMTINFNSFVKVPKEVRAEVKFTNNSIRKYKESWESIETKLIVTDVDIDAIKLNAIEALLKRISPTTANPVISQPIVSEVQPKSESEFVKDVVADSQTVNTKDTKEPELDFSDLFADLIEPETPEEVRDRKARLAKAENQDAGGKVTAAQIAKASTKPDMSQEKKEAIIKEAEGIQALINKFGGVK